MVETSEEAVGLLVELVLAVLAVEGAMVAVEVALAVEVMPPLRRAAAPVPLGQVRVALQRRSRANPRRSLPRQRPLRLPRQAGALDRRVTSRCIGSSP